MNHTTLKTLFFTAALGCATLHGQLTWNGPSPGDWDFSTSNWLDAGNNPVTFTNGQAVSFTTAGSDVNLAANIAFGGAGMSVTNGLLRIIGDTDNAYNLGGTGGLVINPGAGNTAIFRNFHVDSQTGSTRATFSGGTTVESGTLYIRVNRGAEAESGAYNFSFGTGDITMQNGSTFRLNGISGSASGTTYLLQNKLVVQGTVTSVPDRGAGPDTGGTNSGNFSLRLGDVDLAGELSHSPAGGGGSGSGGPHGISGTITLDQSSSKTLALRAVGGVFGTGNQGFTITGNIVDGAGGAGNQLILQPTSVDNTARVFQILGTGNTYSGGTIIDATSNGAARVQDAENGFHRALVVGVDSALGTGNVTVSQGGLLTLRGDNNINSEAVLTINNRGFIHLDNVDLTFNTVDSVWAWNSTANDLISLSAGSYSVSQLNSFFGNNSVGDATFHGTGTITVIPEPGTLVLVGIALGSLLLFRRRR